MFSSTAVATAVERRRGKRYLLRLACRVTSWDGHFEEMLGTTTDMSRTGVRVVFSDEVAPPRVVRIGDEDPTGPTAAFEIARIRVRERNGRLVDEDPATKLLQ